MKIKDFQRLKTDKFKKKKTPKKGTNLQKTKNSKAGPATVIFFLSVISFFFFIINNKKKMSKLLEKN